MDTTLADAGRIALVGIGATAVMDLWLALLRRAGRPTMNFALLGRWLGHVARGRWFHAAIAQAAPVRGERALGLALHYATGIAFAFLLAGVAGAGWLAAPTPGPALAVGIATVAAPLFVLQPAMGAGIAATRTAAPVAQCLRSLANHAVFGAGLYLSAVLLALPPR